MNPSENSSHATDQAEKRDRVDGMLKRSEHLANFGTLTSLVSTAFYFFEQTREKKLPKWLNNLSLGAVGVGIMSVFVSFYYRLKAGNIVLARQDGDEMKQKNIAATQALATDSADDNRHVNAQKLWTTKQAQSRSSAEIELSRK